MSKEAKHRDLTKDPWWVVFFTTEPAFWHGLITALVTLGLVWGVDFANIGDKLSQTADILAVIVVLLGSVWTRNAVRPEARVVTALDKGGRVVAGPGLRLTRDSLED